MVIAITGNSSKLSGEFIIKLNSAMLVNAEFIFFDDADGVEKHVAKYLLKKGYKNVSILAKKGIVDQRFVEYIDINWFVVQCDFYGNKNSYNNILQQQCNMLMDSTYILIMNKKTSIPSPLCRKLLNESKKNFLEIYEGVM